MKLIIEINDLNLFKLCDSLDNVEGIILPLKELSLSDNPLSIEDFKTILNTPSRIKKYVNVERIFLENEFDEALVIINQYQELIDGVFLSDLGMMNKLKNYSFKKIYYAPTYLTNSYDIKEYLNYFDMVVISSEITKEELAQIVGKVSDNVMVSIFGMNQIFYSRRPLITNYFKYKGIELDPHLNNYTVKEETRSVHHHILEDEYGTYIYEENYYKLDTLPNVPYGLIHMPFLNSVEKEKIIRAYNDYLDGKELQLDIPTYSGAYELEVGLLKGDQNEEN